MITIRGFKKKDWPALWPTFESVFRAGDTYPFAPTIGEDEAHRAWIDKPTASYVAHDQSNRILGSYYIKPNQPSLGAHVCNCGYVDALVMYKEL